MNANKDTYRSNNRGCGVDFRDNVRKFCSLTSISFVHISYKRTEHKGRVTSNIPDSKITLVLSPDKWVCIQEECQFWNLSCIFSCLYHSRDLDLRALVIFTSIDLFRDDDQLTKHYSITKTINKVFLCMYLANVQWKSDVEGKQMLQRSWTFVCLSNFNTLFSGSVKVILFFYWFLFFIHIIQWWNFLGKV